MSRRTIGTVLSVALLVALTACGRGGSSQGGTSTPSPSTPQSGSSASSTSTPPPDQGLHGLIVAYTYDKTAVELQALDPETGTVTATRRFDAGDTGATIGIAGFPVAVWRQAFNADFTKIVAQGPEQADGSVGAGYIEGSKYTEVTAPASEGYSVALKKQVIAFNPKTDDLWYQTPQDNGSSTGLIGKVDLETGKDTVVPDFQPSQNGMIGGYNDGLYFTSDGVPHDVAGRTDSLYMPNGKQVTRAPQQCGFQINKIGKYDIDEQAVPASPSCENIGWMQAVVDSKRFITQLDYKLYLNTITPGTVKVKALLPKNARQATDVAVSPDGKNLLFLLNNGNAPVQLWRVSLDGSPELVQIKGFAPVEEAQFMGIVSWEE